MLLLLVLGWLALSPFSSASSEVQTADFCTDPYAAICGAQDELGLERDARTVQMFEPLKAQSEVELAAKYGFSPPTTEGDAAFTRAHPELAASLLGDFKAFLRQLGVEALGDSPLSWQNRIEAEIIGALDLVIDSQASLGSEGKSNFKSALAKLELVSAADIQAAGESHPLWPNFVYQCSLTGLRDNAFHPPGQDTGPQVVLCPGMILAARSDPRTSPAQQDMLPGSIWTMAHETGHTIDFERFPAAYSSMRACVERRFIQSQVLGGFDGLAPASPAYLAKLEAHMEEIAADHWANEVLARKIGELSLRITASSRTDAGLQSRTQGLDFLRTATQGLCGYHDDGKRYGSDKFRIGLLMGRNPRLRSALGCATPLTELPTCTF